MTTVSLPLTGRLRSTSPPSARLRDTIEDEVERVQGLEDRKGNCATLIVDMVWPLHSHTYSYGHLVRIKLRRPMLQEETLTEHEVRE